MAIFKRKKRLHVNLEIAADNNEAVRATASSNKTKRGASFQLGYRSPYHGRLEAAGIDFYDMGRVKQSNGIYQERSFEAILTWHTGAPPGAPEQTEAFYNPLSATDWTAYKNFLLTLPDGKTLKDVYWKFDYESSDFYYVDVENYAAGDTTFAPLAAARPGTRTLTYKYPYMDVATNNWTAGKGLKLDTQKPHLRVKNYGYFEEFDTGDTVNFKVTATNAYSDPAVSFNVAASHADVFLVPRLYLELAAQADIDASSYSPSTVESRKAYTSALFVQMPRIFVTRAQKYLSNGIPYNSYGEMGFELATDLSAEDAAYRAGLENIIYGRSNKRMLKINDTDPLAVTVEVADLSEWGAYMNFHIGEGPPEYHSYRRYMRTYNLTQQASHRSGITGFYNDDSKLSVPQSGSLVAVIKQGAQTYYVWAKRENPGYHLCYALETAYPLHSAFVPLQPAGNGVAETFNQWNLRS